MLDQVSSATDQAEEANSLRLVVQGTASETGQEFFRALVKNLAAAMGTLAAWVTEYFPDKRHMRALAMWLDTDFVEYEYDIVGTVCERVIDSRQLIHIPDRLIELFPADTDLRPLHAVSYLGTVLLDTDGALVGHIAVLDTKPMPRDSRAISLFEIFAARAAAEHRRLKVEAELRHREGELSTILETAMDGILVLDAELKIVRSNQAAARLFACTDEDLRGEPISDFLTPEGAARLTTFARELSQRPEGRQQVWVPQDFVARRWDHSIFPAEATLSRFENRSRIYHTLILRNVDEKLEAERQLRFLTQEAEYLRDAVRELPGFGELLGRSEAMKAVLDAAKQVAATDATVLVTGETGTGKEVVARMIHRASRRAEQPLVVVNCAAIPANLIESEFFGHERGAFTGATNRREGRFALADRGTIFLDEVGELPLELQAKLLRVLQEGEFEPLGANKTRKVDVRVLAATNRDLKQMVSEGKFREDLFFRLHVFPIQLPPLRDRGRDVELLATCFAQRIAQRLGKKLGPWTDPQLHRLRAYPWPGNVRELQNVIERAVILTNGTELQLERAFCGLGPAEPAMIEPEAHPPQTVRSAQQMMELEQANLKLALKQCGGRVSGPNGAARLLGIPPSTFASRMKALGLPKS